jgi:acyl dehydratase
MLPGVVQGLPGVHGIHAGSDWFFYRPVLVNDQIRPECIFTGFDEKPSTFADKLIMEYQEATYNNQRGELVGKAKSWVVRVERRASRNKRKYLSIKFPHPWTDEELKRLEDEILSRRVTGSTVRYWEDVRVDQELEPLVKGPLGITDEVAFIAGSGIFPLVANEVALRNFRRHPHWGFRDPETFAMEPLAGVHWNKNAAKAAGLPYPYDIGVQRHSWLIQLLTDWMGDDGWLKTSYAEYRNFVYLSDVVWIRGKITRKYVDENGEYCVDIESTAVNQRGEDTMPGRATVILPSRLAGSWPVKERLPTKIT